MSRDEQTLLEPIRREAEERTSGERATDSVTRRLSASPLPPKDARVEVEGTGVRLVAIDRGRDDSGTVRYVVRWAGDVDTTSDSGKLAGYVRGVPVESIDCSGKDGEELSRFLADPKYQTGYFFFEGVNGVGQRSVDFVGPRSVSGAILDGTLPDNVEHFDVSESGVVHDSGVVSLLTFNYRTPKGSSNFGGLQLYLRDWPNLEQTSQGYFHRFDGVPGGSATGAVPYEPSRRKGAGTISISLAAVTGVGTAFLAIAQAGDQIEVLGSIATIQTVNSNTSITLTANWGGPPVSALAEYHILGLVTIYAVSISKTNVPRPIDANTPFKKVIMDGLLSPPLPPASVLATAFSNGVRLEWPQILDSHAQEYEIYRSTGSADTFATAKIHLATIPHNQNIVSAGTNRVWEDTEFSTFEREQGQVFRYYLTAKNKRGQESTTYATDTEPCRLAASSDGSPPTTSSDLSQNLLWNGHIFGTALNTVATTDTSQDTHMGGGAPPAGHARWGQFGLGAPVVTCGHENQTEVILPAPGAGKAIVLAQKIGAWGAAAGSRRIRRGVPIVLSIHARRTPGVPNGSFQFTIVHRNLGADVGNYYYRRRLSNDTIDTSLSIVEIAGSDMTEDHQRYWAVFVPDPLNPTTDEIEVRIAHAETSNGVNINVTMAMLHYGQELSAWTAAMAPSTITHPNPGVDPPGLYQDKDGLKKPWIQVP